MGNEFSVLMLVYAGDRPDQFDAALRSITAQTLPPAEIVLVVDGPVPEGTDAVIRKYQEELASSGTEFRIIRSEKNLGCGGAKRLGFGQCTYPLIAMMDADDLSVPDRFEKQMQFFREHPDTAAARLQALGAEALNAPYKHMPPELLEAFAARGTELSLWTVDEPEAMRELMKKDVLNITTRRAAEAVRVREALQAELA